MLACIGSYQCISVCTSSTAIPPIAPETSQLESPIYPIFFYIPFTIVPRKNQADLTCCTIQFFCQNFPFSLQIVVTCQLVTKWETSYYRNISYREAGHGNVSHKNITKRNIPYIAEQPVENINQATLLF